MRVITSALPHLRSTEVRNECFGQLFSSFCIKAGYTWNKCDVIHSRQGCNSPHLHHNYLTATVLRISHRRRPRQQYTTTQLKRYRTNAAIKVPEVRLIDETGQNIGVTSTADALARAQELGLDLVEVSPLANPPVAKIVDYAKLKYEEEKERRKEKAKQKKIEIKGIRLSVRIGAHDMDVRLRQALNFLEDGDKIKIELILRGRERRQTDLAKETVEKFVTALRENREIKIEQPIKIMGGRLSAIIA